MGAVITRLDVKLLPPTVKFCEVEAVPTQLLKALKDETLGVIVGVVDKGVVQNVPLLALAEPPGTLALNTKLPESVISTHGLLSLNVPVVDTQTLKGPLLGELPDAV